LGVCTGVDHACTLLTISRSIGTDTGGSVRLPAAYTGIFGFKPSYGLISRWGVVAYANSLDTVGILADDVAKIRILHGEISEKYALQLGSYLVDVLSVYDPQDPTSLPVSTRNRIEATTQKSRGKSRLRIGIPMEYNTSEIDPIVRKAWASSLKSLQKLGHQLIPISLPSTQLALSAYYVLAPAEASSNLAKYDGVRYGTRPEGLDMHNGVLYAKTRDQGLGPEVRRRILLGSYSLSSEAIDNYFIKAQKIRRLIQREFDSVFSRPNLLHDTACLAGDPGVDILVCPTAANLPPKLSELTNMTPVQTYMTDVFTVPASLAGLPAISVPVPTEEGAGAIGIQVIGQYGTDELVLDVAKLMQDEGLTAPALAQRKPGLTSTSSRGLDSQHAEDASVKDPKAFGSISKDLWAMYQNTSRYYRGGIRVVQYQGENKK
jgi:aspartyl-tRNA(Asn)/glutamyl-tRNA(Gln) amidotransferase subunit A